MYLILMMYACLISSYLINKYKCHSLAYFNLHWTYVVILHKYICLPVVIVEQKPFEDVSPPPPVSNSRMSHRVAVPIPRAMGVSFNDELLHSELHTPRIYSRAGSVTSSLNKPLSSPQFNKHPLSAFRYTCLSCCAYIQKICDIVKKAHYLCKM